LLAITQIAHAVKQGLPSIVQNFFNPQAIKFVADFQAVRQGQAGFAFKTVAQAGGRQGKYVDDDGRGVVMAAVCQRQTAQGRGGGPWFGMIEQDLDHQGIGQNAPDAIGNQQKTVVDRKIAIGEVHQDARIKANGAGKDVVEFRMFPGVVDRHLLQKSLLQTVDPAIANVRGVKAPAAQDQRRKGGCHPRQLGVAAALGDHPAVQRRRHGFNRARHAPGVRRREVIGKQAAHGVFRGFPATFVATDAIGDGGKNSLVIELLPFRRSHATKVLVPFARPGQ
jgi:hypothetical protein